jgi:hypothetical protein
MGPPISAFPMPPSSIAVDAAVKAASDLKRSKNNSGTAFATSRVNMERLRRRSRKISKEFEQAMEKNVKRKLDSLTGTQNNRKVGLKVAQFIPGKGMEIPGTQMDVDPSVYCSLGLKGDKISDPLEETFKTIKGRKVSMDFAFKLIQNKSKLLDQDKETRVTAMNCFRHVNPDSFNNNKTGWFIRATSDDERKANIGWHSTLGPDGSYIRKGPSGSTIAGNPPVATGDCGTYRGVDGDGTFSLATSYDQSGSSASAIATHKSNSLISPFRYPNDMEVMYSRINRQLIENYGWMLNPYKFSSFSQSQYEVIDGVTQAYDKPGFTNMGVWANPKSEILEFNSSFNATKKSSFPCQVNTVTDHVSGQTGKDVGFEWHSQFGPGSLSYQFQNDGTNPVCIDICVVGIKKDSPVSVALLQDICQYNYDCYKFSNGSGTDLNGFQTLADINGSGSPGGGDISYTLGSKEWHANGKMPFMPDVCFKNPQSFLKAADPSFTTGANGVTAKAVYESLEQGKKNPFKVVKRDQFIVSSGASRAWKTTLPSIKYRPQLYEDVPYPLDESAFVPVEDRGELNTTADEYTFVLCIGASGMPKPVEEIVTRNLLHTLKTEDGTYESNKPVDTRAIIDRQPTTCNVAVVGTYTETIYPTFPKDRTSLNFINGRLTEPYFSDAPTRYVPNTDNIAQPERVNIVDIATLGQTVQVATDGTIGVGAITTNKGA